jgi:hypothetical protein
MLRDHDPPRPAEIDADLECASPRAPLKVMVRMLLTLLPVPAGESAPEGTLRMRRGEWGTFFDVLACGLLDRR